LRAPRTFWEKLAARIKRLLFRRVDHFVHYFRDFAAVHAAYGIGGSRAAFVPFKSNIWEQRAQQPDPEGEYALCFGRSLRDYDTFFEAVEISGVPGAITDPKVSKPQEHGSRFSRSIDQLPSNIRVLTDDFSNRAQAEMMRRARVIVVPVVKGSIVASGISTILNAMALGKCIIASAGPGVSDLFTDELLVVPPEDPAALAVMLRCVWDDDALRAATARRGWEYGRACGGEPELFGRLIDYVAETVPRKA
jgi:glycosyltransferase involved in cell wall biosynthesis